MSDSKTIYYSDLVSQAFQASIRKFIEQRRSRAIANQAAARQEVDFAARCNAEGQHRATCEIMFDLEVLLSHYFPPSETVMARIEADGIKPQEGPNARVPS